MKNKRIAFIILFIIVLTGSMKNDLEAQYELDVLKSWNIYDNARNSLSGHLFGIAFSMLEARTLEIREIKTLQEWQKRQEKIRETLLDIIGPFPERTPLNARVMRTIIKED